MVICAEVMFVLVISICFSLSVGSENTHMSEKRQKKNTYMDDPDARTTIVSMDQ